MQVSVIIITYEPNINKLVSTLLSVICQKNIKFEVIISDDGSKRINIDDVERTILRNHPHDIPLQFIKNRTNLGTVSNIYCACKYAKGEYIKIISPGDFLYDDNVLYDFYTYAKNKPTSSLFFGRPIYYSNIDKLEIYDTSTPLYPSIYNNKRQIIQNLSLIHGHGPVGASYFYKAEELKKYLRLVVGRVKYVEDYSTSMLYLLDGGKLTFFDRNIVWYEFGYGLSTSNPNKWKDIYENDCNALYLVAKKTHAHNSYLDFRFGDRKKRILHPFLIIHLLWINFISKRRANTIIINEEQISYLRHIIDNTFKEDIDEL